MENQLHEMFPGVDARTVDAIIIAAGGALDQATQALLYLSDENSDIAVPKLEQPPQIPARPTADQQKQRQMEIDEQYARELAREYRRKPQPKQQHAHAHAQPAARRADLDSNSDEDDFVEAINKNLNDAKNIVGGWFGNVAKKLQGEEEQQQRTPKLPPRLPSRRSTASTGLYSAVDSSSKDGLVLHDVTGKQLPDLPAKIQSQQPPQGITLNNMDDSEEAVGTEAKSKSEEPKPEVKVKEEKTKDKKNDKWSKLTEVAPEPSSTTQVSTVNATSTDVDDSGFVVDDSEEDEVEDEVVQEATSTKDEETTEKDNITSTTD